MKICLCSMMVGLGHLVSSWGCKLNIALRCIFGYFECYALLEHLEGCEAIAGET